MQARPDRAEGPGLPRRLAGEIVPGLAGLLAFLFLWPPLTAWPLAALAGLATWIGLSSLLRRLRRSANLRRAYRLVLLAHVVFWSAAGLRESRIEPPGPVRVAGTVDWRWPRPLAAGAGEARFELPARAPLAGFGHFPRRKTFPAFAGLGVLGRASLRLMGPPEEGAAPRVPLFRTPESAGQALGARAVVLLSDDGEASTPPVAFVRLDLVEGSSEITERVLDRVRPLGFAAPTLLVSATHTHSGPGGYLRDPLAEIAGTGHFDAGVVGAVVDAAAAAIERAVNGARPARIAFASSRDRGSDGRPILAENRRGKDRDAIDDRVDALRVEDAATGRILALVLNYAVHPVYRDRTHMAYDRDLAGALEDALSARLEGHPPVLFVNGAEGDVTFRHPAPGLADLAARFADRVAPDLAAGPAFRRLRVVANLTERDLGTPFSWAALGSAESFLDDVVPSAVGASAPAVAANVLALPVNAGVWSLGLSEVRWGFSFRGSAGVVLSLRKMLRDRRFRFGSLVLEAASGDGGSASRTVLWCPCEANQSVGKRWRRRAESHGAPSPMVFGLTNGAMSYIASSEDYVSGGYEARATLFGAETDRHVEEALLASLRHQRGTAAFREKARSASSKREARSGSLSPGTALSLPPRVGGGEGGG